MSVEKTENEISNKNKENFIGDELVIHTQRETYRTIFKFVTSSYSQVRLTPCLIFV